MTMPCPMSATYSKQSPIHPWWLPFLHEGFGVFRQHGCCSGSYDKLPNGPHYIDRVFSVDKDQSVRFILKHSLSFNLSELTNFFQSNIATNVLEASMIKDVYIPVSHKHGRRRGKVMMVAIINGSTDGDYGQVKNKYGIYITDITIKEICLVNGNNIPK